MLLSIIFLFVILAAQAISMRSRLEQRGIVTDFMIVNNGIYDIHDSKDNELWLRKMKADGTLMQYQPTGFLAQAFDLTGAEIKNSVMQAACFSAALNKSIGMAEVVRALLMEFSKMDKMVPRSVWGRYAYMVDHVEAEISQNA